MRCGYFDYRDTITARSGNGYFQQMEEDEQFVVNTGGVSVDHACSSSYDAKFRKVRYI